MHCDYLIVCDEPMRRRASQVTGGGRHHASQEVGCCDHETSQGVSSCDHPTSQEVSCGDHEATRGVSCCDHHTSQGATKAGDDTLPPGFSGFAHVNFGTSPEHSQHRHDLARQIYRKCSQHQQDLLEQSLLEEMGSEDGWEYCKDPTDGTQPRVERGREKDLHDMEHDDDDDDSQHANTIEGGPPPPSPRLLPPVPGPPSCAPAVAGLLPKVPKLNRAGTTVIKQIMNTIKNEHEYVETASLLAENDGRATENVHGCAETAFLAAVFDGLTRLVQPPDIRFGEIKWLHSDNMAPSDSLTRAAVAAAAVSSHENGRASETREKREPMPPQRSACAIANTHLASSPLPRSGGRGERPSLPQQAQDEVRRHPQLLRGSDQQHPPQPRGEDLSHRHRRTPPALPPPCFTLEYFQDYVQILEHWCTHYYALRHSRDIARASGTDSWRFDESESPVVSNTQTMRGKAATDFWSDKTTTRWCWHELVSQLDDASIGVVVKGSKDASGLLACQVCEGGTVDSRRPSDADKATSNGKEKEVLYHWEFALLRDNGTVAFLRPTDTTAKVEYYEGLPHGGVSAVATPQSRQVIDSSTHEVKTEPIFQMVRSRDYVRSPVCVQFPSMSSLTLTPVQTLNFLHHRKINHDLRGAGFRPPQRANMAPRSPQSLQ